MAKIYFHLVYENHTMSLQDVPERWRDEVQKMIDEAEAAKAQM